MRITARVDYAVRAATELAAAPPGPMKGDALATGQGIPVKFLENILADLRRAGLVARASPFIGPGGAAASSAAARTA